MATTKLQAIGKTADGQSVTATLLDDVPANLTSGQLNQIAAVFQPLVTYTVKTLRLITTDDINAEINPSIKPGTDYLASDDTLRVNFILGESKQTRSYNKCATPNSTGEDDLLDYTGLVSAFVSKVQEVTGYVPGTATLRSVSDYNVTPQND